MVGARGQGSIRRWGRVGPAALAMVVGLVGACGGDDDDESGGSRSEPDSEQDAESTTSTLPEAADGTDLAACSDGDCEVEVAVAELPLDIALDGALGIDNVTVNAITDTLDVDSVGWGAQQGAEVPVGSPAGLNNLVVTLVAADGDVGIIRFAPSESPVSLPSPPSIDVPSVP